MTYRIRRSEVSDTEALGRVAAQAWQETYASVVSSKVLATVGSIENRTKIRRDFFAKRTPDWGQFLVETEQKEIVGFCDCGPADKLAQFAPAEIFTLYVLRSAQDSGLGSKMFQMMLKHIALRDFNSAALNVFINNERARLFYEGMGGGKVGEIEGDFGGTFLPLAVYLWPNLRGLV